MLSVVVVRDQIVETETVVAVDKVNALVGTILSIGVVVEEIAAAVEPRHQGGHHSRITLDVAAQIVAVLTVPLTPGEAGKAASKFVGSGIPSLRDETETREMRI